MGCEHTMMTIFMLQVSGEYEEGVVIGKLLKIYPFVGCVITNISASEILRY